MGRGAPRFLAKCQPLEVAPRFLTLYGEWEGQARGRGYPGANSSRARTCSHPPTHHYVPHPRKCGAELGARRHPGGRRGR